jgi:uncharacterized membrane protein YccC
MRDLNRDRWGKLSGYLPLPQPQVLRHATRMTIAAVLVSAAAWAFALPPPAPFVIGPRTCATVCLLRSYGVPRLSPKEGHNPWFDWHHGHQSRRS